MSGSIITAPMTPTKMIPGMKAQVDQLFTLEDVDPIGRTEALIYGPPGSGKTVLAATFPGPFRWLAADGPTSLKSVRWAVQAGRASITSLTDLQAYSPRETPRGRYIEKPNALNLMTDMIDYWFSKEQVGLWQTLVIDSFTEVNEWALDLGLSLNQQYPKPDKPLSTSDEINRKAMTRLVTGQQDYKSAMGLITGILRNIRTECAVHNKNLVIICHEWQDEAEGPNGSTVITAVRPLLIGQLREKVAKDFDDVWHMETYNKGSSTEYMVTVNSSNKMVAKTRWGTILPRETEPDFRKMIAKVKEFHEENK